MKKQKAIKVGNTLFVGISILGLGSVSLLSLYNPQATMDLVRVNLTNTDAISSIRGIYGGVGLTIVISLCYLLFQRVIVAVQFLTLFWCSYALSRLITIFIDGPLGGFGNQWIVIESIFFLFGIILLFLNRNLKYEQH
ncbi:DUF4345 domain-containing protein [Solitalea lacus]|uniref:DUF4345 domain-containing protein n=1 Tax=Solitalea lacus TaxID=2911172 RepID=UPI001EDC291B|nr:DUF4345 domain-containing protein [Solitalea lacus]UKJ06663.1 DUF4345 domain-containing protein [Solitalea lacus]